MKHELDYTVIRSGNPPGRALLVVSCVKPDGTPRSCNFGLSQNGPISDGLVWGWDGNIEKPTVNPSINCHGGCGRHFTLINGVPNWSDH